jgi:hypothetical protein
MAWKSINHKSYYYHMVRYNGQIRSAYIPADQADEYERATQARKADRLARRQELSDLRARIAVEEQPLIAYHNMLVTLYSFWKESNGFHRHGNTWRRTGPITRRTLLMNKSAFIDIQKAIAAELARRAVADGKVNEFVETYNGHADQNSLKCLLHVAPGDDRTKEAFRLRVEQLKDSLAGPNPSALVDIMATRVAIGWLDVYLADGIYYMWMSGHDIEQATYFDRRRGRATRRLIQAVKCLADIQRIKPDDVNARLPRFEFAMN